MESLDFNRKHPKKRSLDFIIPEDAPAKKPERPPCPECGASNPESRGGTWRCRACGRKFTKIRRPRVYDYSQNPSCPDCHASKTIKNGGKWYCKECGKQWVKTNSSEMVFRDKK